MLIIRLFLIDVVFIEIIKIVLQRAEIKFSYHSCVLTFVLSAF